MNPSYYQLPKAVNVYKFSMIIKSSWVDITRQVPMTLYLFILCFVFFKPAFAVIYIKLLEVSWAQILTFIQLLIFHPFIHEK